MNQSLETVESVHKFIKHIIKEIMDKGLSIDQPTVSALIDAKISDILIQYEQKCIARWGATEEARRVRDEATRREWLEEAQNARETIAKLEAERVSYLQENKRLRTQLEQIGRFDSATAGQQADERCKWISYVVTSPHSCLPVSLTNTNVQAEVNPQPKVRSVP